MAEQEFEQVVNMYYGMLYRFALSLARAEAEACDLTQQTFYLWATRGHQLRDSSKLKSWLLTTLHREFLATRRHETRFPHVEVGSVDRELPSVSPTMINQMDADTVMQALLEVDETYRTALTLFYLEDLSYKEIAAVLDIATGTVMSRLARGKDQLRHALAIHLSGAGKKVIPLKRNLAGGENG